MIPNKMSFNRGNQQIYEFLQANRAVIVVVAFLQNLFPDLITSLIHRRPGRPSHSPTLTLLLIRSGLNQIA